MMMFATAASTISTTAMVSSTTMMILSFLLGIVTTVLFLSAPIMDGRRRRRRRRILRKPLTHHSDDNTTLHRGRSPGRRTTDASVDYDFESDDDEADYDQPYNDMEVEEAEEDEDEFEAFINSMPHLRRLRHQWESWRDDIGTRLHDHRRRRRRRRLWPWQNRHRSRSRSPTGAAAAAAAADEQEQSASPERHQQDKSGLCIGSIFGMDVGGTLAKLVYFEETAIPEMPHSGTTTTTSTSRGGEGVEPTVSSSSSMDDAELFLHNKARQRRSLSFTTSLRQARQQGGRIGMSHDDSFLVPIKPPAPAERAASEGYLDVFHAHEEQEEVQTLSSLSSKVDGIPSMLVEERDDSEDEEPTATSASSTSPMPRKSSSMFEMSLRSRNHAQALNYFYHVAKSLDAHRVGRGVRDDKLSFYSRELGGEIHFMHFETRYMQTAMDLIKAHDLHVNICEMGCTGGGAHKFAHVWQDELGIEMKKQDELDSLVAGMQFVLSTVVGECYTFRPRVEHQPKAPAQKRNHDHNSTNNSTNNIVEITHSNPDSSLAPSGEENPGLSLPEAAAEVASGKDPDNAACGADDASDTSSSDGVSMDGDRGKGDEWWWSRKVQRDMISYSSTYPYLVVTIGTGVSILRVDGPRKYERVSGSTIGGGTYWGLMRLLTSVENYEDVLKLAERGDPSKVDMAVGDIYGENSEALEKIGLPSNITASSFGKLVAKEDPADNLKEEDLARALLLMITNNIGLVSYLNAKLNNTNRIYFVGNFLRRNKISQRRLAYAISYWSKGGTEALFLEHEGYFGALGAFLLNQNISNHDDDDEDGRGLSNNRSKTKRQNAAHVDDHNDCTSGTINKKVSQQENTNQKSSTTTRDGRHNRQHHKRSQTCT